MWSLPAIAVVVGTGMWLMAGRYVATDNAYLKGERAFIASELSGLIIEVAVQENQRVSRGQLLFRLDETPYRLANSSCVPKSLFIALFSAAPKLCVTNVSRFDHN